MDPKILEFIKTASDIVTIAGYIGATTGMIISIKTYRNNIENEKIRRQNETFNDLDNKYVEFMYKCTEYPHLDLFSSPIDTKNRLITQEDLRIERAFFAVLISIFERVFVMFEQRIEERIYQDQYPGWIECMRSYCLRESFTYEWKMIGCQFDSKFQRIIIMIINEEERIKSIEIA